MQSNKELETGPLPAIDRCWNEVGIWGKGVDRCPRLKEFIHCNNCDVFKTNSHHVYEKEVIPEYANEWTRLISQKKEESRKTNRSVLIFRLGQEWVSLPTVTVKQIVHVRAIQKLPHNRNRFLNGIANISGSMELCFSLWKILGIEDIGSIDGEDDEQVDRSRIICAVYNKNKYIFNVSEVGEISRFSDEDEQELPSTLYHEAGSFMSGIIDWKDCKVGNIDPDLLFSLIDRSLQ